MMCDHEYTLFQGGMAAGCHDKCECSIPVYKCRFCDDLDYGDNAESRARIDACAIKRVAWQAEDDEDTRVLMACALGLVNFFYTTALGTEKCTIGDKDVSEVGKRLYLGSYIEIKLGSSLDGYNYTAFLTNRGRERLGQ
jgi:hypothetical protein